MSGETARCNINGLIAHKGASAADGRYVYRREEKNGTGGGSWGDWARPGSVAAIVLDRMGLKRHPAIRRLKTANRNTANVIFYRMPQRCGEGWWWGGLFKKRGYCASAA